MDSDALSAIFAGLGGGLEGAAKGYSWQKDYEQKDRAITSREDIARLKEEIRQMIADAAEKGRNDRHETPSGDAVVGAESRATVANITQGGANYRHDNASGDAVAREAGQDRRLTRNLDFGYDLEAGRNQRWATPSGNARLGAETTRRGQDMSTDTSRYATDTGAATAQRGQDVRSRDSRYGADRRNAMFQGIFGPTPVTPSSAPAPAPAGGGGEPPEVPAAAQAPVRPAVRPSGRTPITPPASTPPPSPAPADAATDREVQRRARFEQIKREITARQQAGRDINDLVKELQKLRTAGGGQ